MDSIKKCSNITLNGLFPKRVRNKPLVYFVNILHIIGVLFIQLGLLMPYPVIKYYILFLIFVYMTYYLFKNECFMTIISNYIANEKFQMLCIKIENAKGILLIYLILALIIYLNPEYTPYTIIKNYFN